jgi:hypothetical protein
MPARARDALWAAAAAVNGAAGIAAARCGGGACTRCFACAVPAAGVVLLALLGGRRKATADRAGEAASGAARPGPG